jgi:cell division protein FtsB
MVISEKARKPVSRRILTVTYLTLLAVTAIVSYLGYSAIMKLQIDQNALQSKYDGLSSQYFGLQANFSELQKNNSDIQFQLTDLHSQFSSLESQQAMLQANYSALQSQHDMLRLNHSVLQYQHDMLRLNHFALQYQHNVLQANCSTLQANYTKFMADYQKLRSTPFSYLVFTDGNGNYYAENGTTRTIDYSGTDLASILNTVLTSGKTCYFLPGEYYLNSTVNVFGKNDVSISGSGLETSIIQVPSDICAFNITGADSNVHNARFSMSSIAINSTTSSTQPAIFIKHMNDIKLDDLSIMEFNVGYDIECTEKVYIYRCKAWSNKTTFSTGFKLVGYSLDIFLIDTLVLHNQPSGVGYSFDDCDGITLINAIANPTVPSYGDDGYGFVFFNCHWVNLIGTLSDGNGSHGYYLSSGFRYYFTGAWAGSNFGNGLQSDSADHIMLSGCSFYTNHMDGIKLSNSTDTTISTVISTGNTEYGLEVSNTKGITVTSSVLTQNGNKGIFLDVGNSYAIVQNNNCMDNSDSFFDIYISTPHSSNSSLVSNNFGRIYQTP